MNNRTGRGARDRLANKKHNLFLFLGIFFKEKLTNYDKTKSRKNKSESFVLSAFFFIRHSLALAGRFWMGGQYQQGVHRSHRNIEALLF